MILAHGIGSRHDLPLPLDLVLQGAAIALLISFLALGLLWTQPRFRGGAAGRSLPPVPQRIGDSGSLRTFLRAVTLAAALAVGFVAVAGPNDTRNPAPHVVYVLFWVGLAVTSMVLGPVWRVINPLRLVHRALRLPARYAYPERLGYWPAAASLLAFTWLELAVPDRGSPRVVALFLGCYAVAQLCGAVAFGAPWFERADGFEVYSSLLGRLAPLGRRDDGRLVLRNPLNGLAAIPVRPGLVAVVAVCLGSTAFDSVTGTPAWARLTQSTSVAAPILATCGLLLAIVVVAATYRAAVGLTGRPAAGEIAHSLVPIVAGYVIAHYYSLLIIEGQRALVLLSDPFATGADLLGIAGAVPDESLAAPGLVAAAQVGAVLTGHILGVVAAHDRSLRLLPTRQQLSGQAPLLLLMVGYTAGGLTLLFAG